MISNQPSDRPHPLKPVPDREEVSFGTWLRRQREIREISLREIADVTKISIRYLEALERDRFDVLPAQVFARGFLREYARYVGLDPDEVVNSYISALEPLEAQEESDRPRRRTSRAVPISRLLLAAVVAALLVAAAWFGFRSLSSEVRTESSRAPEPMDQRTAAPEGIVDSTTVSPSSVQEEMIHRVDIEFVADGWIETVVDGGERRSEVYRAGESLEIDASERIAITVDDPAAVVIEIDGLPVAFDSDSEVVPSTLEIDLTTLQSREASPQ